MKIPSKLFAVPILFALAAVLPAQASSANAAHTFANPVKINRGGDPSLYRGHDGNYYFTSTEGFGQNTRITLRKASEPQWIAYGEQKTVWWPEAAAKDIWAPELFSYQGVWYIYYAKTYGGHAGRRMYVLECKDADPINGHWTDLGQITDATNLFAIDGAAFVNHGQLYFIWSGWESARDNAQRIYIAAMSDPHTLSSPRTCISSPTEAWEKHKVPVNEGPNVLVKNGKVYITFSGSQANTEYYALGLVTAEASSNLLDAASWKKTGPLFSQHDGVYGVGGNSFIPSPDGQEDWLAYHGFGAVGQWGDERDVFLKKIEWRGDVPDFGTPPAYGTALPVPSGSTTNYAVYEAEQAEVSGGRVVAVKKASEYHGFTGTGYVDCGTDSGAAVSFAVTAAEAGTHTLLFRYTNDTAAAKTLKLTINGQVVDAALRFPATGNGVDARNLHFYNYTRVEVKAALKAGHNTIKLETAEGGGPWLDCLLVTE